jgi:hypothetical protein
MRVTAVNCVGLGIALICGSVAGRSWVSALARRATSLVSAIPPLWVMSLFLLVGGASSLYVFAFDSGQRPDEVAPGIIRTMTFLLIVVSMVSAAQGGWWFTWLAVILTLIQALVGLVLLSKAGVLLPIMALVGGLAWRLGVKRVVVPGIVALLAVFMVIAGPITTARNVYGISVYGDNEWIQVDFKERLSLLPNAVSRAGDFRAVEEYNAWVRFCYLPPQAAGLDLYDAGDGSEDYLLLGWAFLPRFLFPDKPIMTKSAGELHTKITGGVGSNTGQGVFIDGYYNLGWAGVIVASICVGCFLAWTSAFAAEVIRTRAILWLPLALVGSYMAFRIDGSFLIDYWGMFILFTYAVAAGLVVGTPLNNSRNP